MNDFTTEELYDAVDRLVWEMLERHGIEEPPVDTLMLAEEEFDFRLVEVEPDEAEETPGRFGPRPRRRNAREIQFRPDHSDASRAAICARACAKELVPRVLMKLGVEQMPEQRGAHPLVSLIVPRLQLPTRWFGRDVRKSGNDLLALKRLYATVSHEVLALRWLDLDEPCVITVVDFDAIALRRSNARQVERKLLPSEERCRAKIQESKLPARIRMDDWTTHGWPIPDGPFGRIILRSLPDEI